MSLAAPKNLRTEYFTNPLGIDTPAPRFSWTMVDSRRNSRQSTYQIQVSTDGEPAWDSGPVDSDASNQICYSGHDLQARTRYQWRVRIWDQDGLASDWSDTAWFETGLLQESWQAQWIQQSRADEAEPMRPVPMFRKTFSLKKDVSRARIYVTALGCYELRLNGRRVGDAYFTPGWTEYDQRVKYQTYDVTDQLQAGNNVIGALLGNGWYCGYLVSSKGKQHYGKVPKLMAWLIVDFIDGTSRQIATDDSWRWAEGPLRYSDFYRGEAYDGTKAIPGWDRRTRVKGKWQPVQCPATPEIQIDWTRGPLVRITEEVKPKSIKKRGDKWVVDFGQNIVGWVRLRIRGKKGQSITLRHAERLDANGELYTENLRSATSVDSYKPAADATVTLEPHFTFHGFQYVEVSGLAGRLTKTMLTGIVLHSDTTRTGWFECSDPLINQLQSNIVWGQRGNYLEVPTDCPQRDERLGWTGDAQVFVRTAAFNMDVAGFYNKWLVDLNDAQADDGRYPHVAPNVLSDNGGVAAWADAGIICPWTIYQAYGDKRVLAEHYKGMRKWIKWQKKNSPGHIRGDYGFGDWLSINADTPRDLIGTAFFAYGAKLMSKIAAVLDKAKDAETYAKLAEKVRKAFCREFVTPRGRLVGNTQTAVVLALHFDLLPKKKRGAAMDWLARNIRQRKTHLSTGFVGSPYINHVLTAGDQLDLAYDLLHQTSWPSWLYAVTQGATTIWERWDGWTEENGFQDAGMNSFNHYAYGAIGEWLYAVCAGLQFDEAEPGGKHIIIEPHPGGGLTHAKAAFDSIYGRVESAWHIEAAVLTVRALIPPNTHATIRVPATTESDLLDSDGVRCKTCRQGRAVFKVGSGSYTFRLKYS